MLTLRRNNQSLKYALRIGEIEEIEKDEQGNPKYVEEYTDDEGNVYYAHDDNGNLIPMTTGERKIIYSEPVAFDANISEQGGSESEALPYGISTADYEATIVYQRGAYPLTEGSLIWFKSEVEYEYNGEEVTITIDDKEITQKIPVETSADFRVVKLSDSLNNTLAILEKMNK